MSRGLPENAPTTDEVEVGLNAVYNWNYDSEIDQLRTLYANALDRQWIALRDLDWETGIDEEKFSKTFSLGGFPIQTTDWWKNLDPDTKWLISRKSTAFLLSNFLHGEQGAMMVAAEMVNAVPHMDAKFYASTQTMDEARHVEVFAAYIKLLDEVQPIMPSLKKILDATIASESWMHKAVGMQVVVEGLALYTFRDMRNASEEPLLKEMLGYVSRDEARHCAYGVKYLGHIVGELSEEMKAELEDFAFEATRLLIDSRNSDNARMSMFQAWDAAGIDSQAVLGEIVKERDKIAAAIAQQGGQAGPVRGFVIPTLRSLGLFSERIEAHFREMFAANLSEERAKAMDFSLGLPTDLEAWALAET